MAKEDNTLLWVGLIAAVFFVLNKTQLVSANSGASAIVPPAPAPTPGTPAAAPPTSTQAAAAPSATVDMNPNNLLDFGPYGY
jgi:hypothetical protein